MVSTEAAAPAGHQEAPVGWLESGRSQGTDCRAAPPEPVVTVCSAGEGLRVTQHRVS